MLARRTFPSDDEFSDSIQIASLAFSRSNRTNLFNESELSLTDTALRFVIDQPRRPLSRNDYFSYHLSNSPAQTILAHVWVSRNQPWFTQFPNFPTVLVALPPQLMITPHTWSKTVQPCYSPEKLVDNEEEHRMYRHAQRHLAVDYCICFSVT